MDIYTHINSLLFQFFFPQQTIYIFLLGSLSWLSFIGSIPGSSGSVVQSKDPNRTQKERDRQKMIDMTIRCYICVYIYIYIYMYVCVTCAKEENLHEKCTLLTFQLLSKEVFTVAV